MNNDSKYISSTARTPYGLRSTAPRGITTPTLDVGAEYPGEEHERTDVALSERPTRVLRATGGDR